MNNNRHLGGRPPGPSRWHLLQAEKRPVCCGSVMRIQRAAQAIKRDGSKRLMFECRLCGDTDIRYFNDDWTLHANQQPRKPGIIPRTESDA